MTRALVMVILLVPVLFGSCGHGDHQDFPGFPSPGPRAFLFGMKGLPDPEGQFVATTSDTAMIERLEAQLALPPSERYLHIHGHIERGNDGNLGWHWHFVPDRWDAVEVSAEICDGTPADVENDLDYWVDQIGIFCPWSSYVQEAL